MPARWTIRASLKASIPSWATTAFRSVTNPLEKAVARAADAMQDRWTGGDDYERYMGRWSRPVADRFLGLAGDPGRSGLGRRGLRRRCALTAAILAAALAEVGRRRRSVAGLRGARDAVVDDPRARFREGGAAALPLGDGSADVVGVRAGPQLRAGPGRGVARDDAGRQARGDDRRIRLGLRGRDAADPAVLGRRRRARSRCGRRRRRPPLPDLRARTRCAARSSRRACRTSRCDRSTSRRSSPTSTTIWSPFLTGVGPAPGYVVALEDGRSSAPARSAPGDAADRAGRLDPPRCEGVGDPRASAGSIDVSEPISFIHPPRPSFGATMTDEAAAGG